MTTAAIYIPPGILDGEALAVEGYEYIKHRGYEYVGAYHQWHYVDQLLQAGIATVVVFARSAHRAPNCRWPAEYADETRRVARPLPPRLDRRVRERYGTVNVSAAGQEDLPTLAILSRRRRQNEGDPRRAEDLVEEAARRLGFQPRP